MALHLAEALYISLISYAVWRVLRPFVVKSALHNIPGPRSNSWWKGNFDQIFDRRGWKFHHDIVEKYGSVVKVHGLFGSEGLYVSDPRALHHIVVKDQYTYEETSVFIAQNSAVFGTSLLSTLGEHHKKQRKMLNPVFSLAHMRDLLPIFYPIAHQLRDVLARQVQKGAEDINVMTWMSRAALEYIGQGGLGYSFDALDDSKTNDYSEAIKMLVPTSFSLVLPRQFLPYLTNIASPAWRRKLLDWTPSTRLQRIKNIVDTMHEQSTHIYHEKMEALDCGEEAVLQQVGRGKDIMSILLRANSAADEGDRLPESELLGQMNTFIFAGHDTTTSALSRILHQLVLNPDVQTKLREEVTEACKDRRDLPYDKLMALPYLDAVCRETLRMHPPIPFLQRTTRKDVTLPLLWPIKSADGKQEWKEIPLKNNTNVIISIIAANRSKAIWGEDAEEWRPERWLKPLPETVAQAHLPGVYASMMTFLGGGRACIGFKFAEMEMKLVLTILLESFVFAPSKEIYWNMGGLQSPVVKGSEDSSPQLPLKVSFVQRGQ